MKYFIILIVTTFLLGVDKIPVKPESEVGRYQIETTTYINKKGSTIIVETILDTKEGVVIKRRKIYASKYKLPYKNRKGRMVTSE